MLIEEYRKEGDRNKTLMDVDDPLEKIRLEKILGIERSRGNQVLLEKNKKLEKIVLEKIQELKLSNQ